MSWDNKVFNVNGRGLEMLRTALKLAYAQHGDNTTAKAWRFVPTHGFVLLWWVSPGDGSNAFPCPMSADGVVSMVWEWLDGADAKAMTCEGWDADEDHDGSNSRGWRVFTGDWGQVAGNTSTICAIRPSYLWHGK
jgi:hypothetical protein